MQNGEEGEELLPWLSRRFSYLSPEDWEIQIAEGRIEVDGRPVGSDHLLVAGELLSFAFDPALLAEPPVDGDYKIIHEDRDFLVVDKPPDLPVHPAGRYFHNTLWSLLGSTFGALHTVTRLDRETSGLVLFARTAEARRHAQLLLDRGELHKEYLAIVHGDFPPRLDARGHLLRDTASAIRKKRAFLPLDGIVTLKGGLPGAESASTDFTLLGRGGTAASGPLSLLRAIPLTGRTHQIRATLFSLGFPLLGDKLYGIDEGFFIRQAEGGLTEEDKSRLLIPAQALHAGLLRFPALDGTSRPFRSPPPSTWPLESFSPLP